MSLAFSGPHPCSFFQNGTHLFEDDLMSQNEIFLFCKCHPEMDLSTAGSNGSYDCKANSNTYIPKTRLFSRFKLKLLVFILQAKVVQLFAMKLFLLLCFCVG